MDFQDVFDTSAMGPTGWLVLVGVAGTVIPVLEIAKWMARHGTFGELD